VNLPKLKMCRNGCIQAKINNKQIYSKCKLIYFLVVHREMNWNEFGLRQKNNFMFTGCTRIIPSSKRTQEIQ